MQLLKERILKDGIVKPGNILKVDSFLNHQMILLSSMKLAKNSRDVLPIARLQKFSQLKLPALELPVLPHSILMFLSFLQKKRRA